MLELMYEMTKLNGRMRARVSARYSDDEPPYVDCVSLDSARSRNRFINTVAERTGLPQQQIERELLKIAHEQATQPAVAPAEKAKPAQLTQEQRRLAEEYLRSPDLLDHIAGDIEKVGVAGERELALTIYLVLLSRLLAAPLKAVVQGAPSAGKTFIVEKVTELFPEEALFSATSLSDMAWYYLPEDAIKHRAVILGEREQNQDPARVDARRAWRELMVSNEATRVVTIRDPVSGEPRVVKKSVRGPCAFIETTTSENLVEEDASRLLPLRPSESEQQTQLVLDRLARDTAGKETGEREHQQILARHHAVQMFLGQYAGMDIRVPYARLIRIPTDQVVARRVFSYVLAMVKVIALLRILQKPPELKAEADLVDYEVAYPLIRPLIERQLSIIKDTDRETLRRLEESAMSCFAISDASRLLGVGERQTRRRLWRLHRMGALAETETSRNNRREFRLAGKSLDEAEHVLTTPDELRQAIAEREAIAWEGQIGAQAVEGKTSDAS